MGKIPSTDRMVSAVITNPQNGDDIPANQDFSIDVQMINFSPGTFTNAQTTYYSAPQDLDGGGNIIGHTHVTVQDTGDDLNPTQPLDPTVFAFFKGINDPGNGQGLLSADVEGGLPAGNYRRGRGGASSATALGGIEAPEVKDTADRDRPFGVKSDTFVTRQAAVERACKIQRNKCFDRCNAGQADGFTRGDCDAQVTACEAELSG
ncbi:hypothetical protein ACRE_026130 [Hapsidospora chrysogenum ATCC 11550]|uniref:Uncharacterized protein n=1 Tax=Hapsidospora chrysogenum (strain ATCC 11550 / CBS 779.69 / DSM 880 / IAM 14645 / JCM 23072 / IMI 49137) TaxID=857340 RepID=A0A086TAW5_HAPC1|nr:hypothetical protein ACRE_026130 [Hapsidospora chrysogenum ATCC 11550]